MSLVLYGHPCSAYTQKVLIALYENSTPFAFRCWRTAREAAGKIFLLAGQFRTQSDPASCGPGTLVVALNALGIDPRRSW